jgi:hypothetical protein
LRDDGEKSFYRQRDNGPLVGKVVGLAFQGKFEKIMCPGKNIQWKIRFPELDLVALIQKNILEPEV